MSCNPAAGIPSLFCCPGPATQQRHFAGLRLFYKVPNTRFFTNADVNAWILAMNVKLNAIADFWAYFGIADFANKSGSYGYDPDTDMIDTTQGLGNEGCGLVGSGSGMNSVTPLSGFQAVVFSQKQEVIWPSETRICLITSHGVAPKFGEPADDYKCAIVGTNSIVPAPPIIVESCITQGPYSRFQVPIPSITIVDGSMTARGTAIADPVFDIPPACCNFAP